MGKARNAQTDATPRYVAYIRVSTDKQGQSGLGLEAQRKAIADFLTSRGATSRLLAEFVEVESGKFSSYRPQLDDAIKRCRLQGATLLVAKLDRLSRSLCFITTIREEGVKFVCADYPEVNDLTINILGAVAEHERKMISERTRAALAAARARGVQLGNPRLADIRNMDTTAAHAKIQRNVDRFAREILPEIQKFMKDGIMTLSALSERLNESGFLTRRGSAWTPMAVKRIRDRQPNLDPREDSSLI